MRGLRNLEESASTLELILEAAQREFLKKGFVRASLRNIVREAGVTTGAFYGYFDSKEALFEALTREQYDEVMSRFVDVEQRFASLPAEEQKDRMGEMSGDWMEWLIGYMYEHISSFKLLLCCAEGTKYENFVHEMVEIEVESTHDFIRVLQSMGQETAVMDPQLEHILVSGMFAALFEVVVHDMTKEQALAYSRTLRAFYMAGWREIFLNSRDGQ